MTLWLVVLLVLLLDSSVLSEMPCKLHHQPYKVQAVTLYNDHLYLLINEQLYSAPFSSSHISKYRIRLYGLKAEGHWHKVGWLKEIANFAKPSNKTLVQLVVWPADKKSVFFASALFQDRSSFEHFATKLGTTVHYSRPALPEKYTVLGSLEAGGGYVVRNIQVNGQDKKKKSKEPVLLVGPKAVEEHGGLYFPTLEWPTNFRSDQSNTPYANYYVTMVTSGGSSVKFYLHVRQTPYIPLELAEPLDLDPHSSFGFVFDGYVHFWDFNQQQVVLFKEPNAVEPGTEVAVIRVKMEDYFACNDAEWNQVSVTSLPADHTQKLKPSRNLVAISLIAVIIGIAFLGLLSIYFCKTKRQSRKSQSSSIPIWFPSAGGHGLKNLRLSSTANTKTSGASTTSSSVKSRSIAISTKRLLKPKRYESSSSNTSSRVETTVCKASRKI